MLLRITHNGYRLRWNSPNFCHLNELKASLVEYKIDDLSILVKQEG